VVEQPIRNRQVVGSTPTLGSTYRFCWQHNRHFQFIALLAATGSPVGQVSLVRPYDSLS
jgi:hypothetical protein